MPPPETTKCLPGGTLVLGLRQGSRPSRSAAFSRNEDFGYRTITVERPERDAAGQIVKATKGKLKGKPQAGRQPAQHRKRAARRGRGNLSRFRQFFLTYPKGATLSHHLGWSVLIENC